MTNKEAIKIINDMANYKPWEVEALYMAIKALEQEPKMGHWIKVTNSRGGHECDLCHEYAPSYQSGKECLTKHCPNCGAKMESEDKE